MPRLGKPPTSFPPGRAPTTANMRSNLSIRPIGWVRAPTRPANCTRPARIASGQPRALQRDFVERDARQPYLRIAKARLAVMDAGRSAEQASPTERLALPCTPRNR